MGLTEEDRKRKKKEMVAIMVSGNLPLLNSLNAFLILHLLPI